VASWRRPTPFGRDAVAGIGVLVNPRAGGNRRAAARAERLGRVVGNAGWVRVTNNLDHLDEVAQECWRRNVDVVAVCGGDGTYCRTLSALVRAYRDRPLPRFLPLRAGTMNTVARAIGAPAWQPERMLAAVVAGYREGYPLALAEHPLLCVNGSTFGFMAGCGVVVGFLRAYYDAPQRGGLGAAAVLAHLIGSALVGGPLAREAFQWVEARVFCDGEPIGCKRFSVIYASTIEDIGLGFRPTYRARERPGHFQVFAGPIGARELVRRLVRIRRGLPTGSASIHDALVRRLEVDFHAPSSYMIDGEIMAPAAGLVVEPGPMLRIIRR
jgi:diacylglycerol kinase (ATP)